MFIHTHQHPILDVLGEHGVPVFIINVGDVHKVFDKKKVNQPYKEEQEEAYSQIMGKQWLKSPLFTFPFSSQYGLSHGSSTGRGRTSSQTKSTVGLLYGY